MPLVYHDEIIMVSMVCFGNLVLTTGVTIENTDQVGYHNTPGYSSSPLIFNWLSVIIEHTYLMGGNDQ